MRARISIAGFLLSLICALPPSAAGAELVVEALEDIVFGQLPPTAGNQRARSRFCVAMTPRGQFRLIGQGTSEGGEFVLREDGGNVVPYRVVVVHRGTRERLRPSQPVLGLRARELRNGRCRPQGRLQVRIDGRDLAAAPPGDYGAILSITVAPE